MENKIDEIKGLMKKCEFCKQPIDFVDHSGDDGENQYLMCNRQNKIDLNQDISSAVYNEALEDAIYILADE